MRGTTGPPAVVAIAVLAVTGALMVGPLYGEIPLVPALAHTFGIDPHRAGYTVLAFGFAYASACLFFGPLSDAVGRRSIILGGVAAEALLNLATAAAPTFPVFLALRVAQGAAAGAFGPVVLGYVIERYTGAVRATALAVISTGLIAAGTIAQLDAQAVAHAYGWRAFPISTGVLELIALLALFGLIQEPPVDRRGRSLARVYRAEAALVRQPAIICTYLIGFGLYGSFVLFFLVLGPHLRHLGFGESQLLIVRAGALPGMLLTLVAGPLERRFTARRVVLAGLAVELVGLGWSALDTGDGSYVSVATAVFACGIAFAAVAMNTVVTSLGGVVRGSALAFYAFVSFTGASFAPVAESALAGAGFRVVVLIMAALAALSLVAMAALVRSEEPLAPPA
jgi:predicted MFS family arabinose efflux permease